MRITLLLFGFLVSISAAAQLMINEVSQGPAGSQEYVEFIVAGNPTCSTPVPCIDLRGVVLDDNNGYFASGSGMGIATGAIRFSSSSFWSCVPQGTLILIYNNADINPSVPADDYALNDGNCRLILPINSNLLEGQSVGPTTADANYPSASSWTAGGGLWAQIGMANGGDSFQIRSAITALTPNHAISWGSNTTNTQIYFSGSASTLVYSFTNAVSNDWFQQANWTSGNTGVDETPGLPNSAANAQWIAQMNPTCGVGSPLSATILESTVNCVNDCNGTMTAMVTGGSSPYTYAWSNGQTTTSIGNLCAGTYSVTVTDQNGCSINLSGTIAPGSAHPIITISTNSPYNLTDNPDQLIGAPAGGTWYSNCSTCLTGTGIFSPQQAGSGTFSVCYIASNGACTDTLCSTIEVSTCVTDTTQTTETYCLGDSIQISGNYIFNDSTFYNNQTDANGCIHVQQVVVNFISCTEINTEVVLPTIFTPNGDNSNDTWYATIQNGTLESGIISNRWGEIVATLDTNHLFWDGKINGIPASEGVYFVRLTVLSASDGKETYQGFVELFR